MPPTIITARSNCQPNHDSQNRVTIRSIIHSWRQLKAHAS